MNQPTAGIRSELGKIASHFNLTDFGSDKTGEDEFIIFPLDKEPKIKETPNEFKSFLDSFVVLGELSPKAKELYELASQHKLKFADSEEFMRATKLGFLRFVSQLVVLRREILRAPQFSAVLNAKAIPISSMGDLELSSTSTTLKDALEFITHQALTLPKDTMTTSWNFGIVISPPKRIEQETPAVLRLFGQPRKRGSSNLHTSSATGLSLGRLPSATPRRTPCCGWGRRH